MSADRLRDRARVRHAAQWVSIVLLVGAAVLFSTRLNQVEHQAADQEATVAVVGSMLAQTCEAASFADLRRKGLVAECRLARAGTIEKAVPQRALPAPGDTPTPDTLPDTPGQTVAPVPVPASVDQAVAEWFADHDLTLAPGYERTLRAAVAQSLATDPPKNGRNGRNGRGPTAAEVAAAVTAALIAAPPADGTNGTDGRGIVNATLDSCDVVFTYTDGTTTRVGPVCGKDGTDGRAPTGEEVSSAVADYCAAHGACVGPAGPDGATGPPGPDGATGPPGYPVSFTTADGQECTDPDGDHRYECSLPAPGTAG